MAAGRWRVTEGEEVEGYSGEGGGGEEQEGKQDKARQSQWHKKHCPDLMAVKSNLPVLQGAADT